MNVGERIAQARNKTAAEPQQVALILFAALFEVGPNRLNAHAKYIAVGTLRAGLETWKTQLETAQENNYAAEKKRADDLKRELDEVKLRLAIALKEQ